MCRSSITSSLCLRQSRRQGTAGVQHSDDCRCRARPNRPRRHRFVGPGALCRRGRRIDRRASAQVDHYDSTRDCRSGSSRRRRGGGHPSDCMASGARPTNRCRIRRSRTRGVPGAAVVCGVRLRNWRAGAESGLDESPGLAVLRLGHAFTALNVVNYCSPGWCATIGFPFPWLTWSDSILTFGDSSVMQTLAVTDNAAAVVAALLDLFVFVAVARLIGRNSRSVAPNS